MARHTSQNAQDRRSTHNASDDTFATAYARSTRMVLLLTVLGFTLAVTLALALLLTALTNLL